MADEQKNSDGPGSNGWFKDHFFELAFTVLCTVILAVTKDDAAQRDLRLSEYKSFYETLKVIYSDASHIQRPNDTIYILPNDANNGQHNVDK